MIGSYSIENNASKFSGMLLKMGFVTCKMKVSMKVFLLNMHKATGFNWSRQASTSFNLLCILNFFYKTTDLA